MPEKSSDIVAEKH